MALGKPLEEILGNQWMQHIHPEHYEECHEAWMRCVATRIPLDAKWLMLQYDGQYRWQHILAHPSFDEHGNVVSWYMMCIEIDQQVRAEQERKRAEDHLHETRAKLNKASRIATVAELSACIAHELNQPLMSVLANAQAGKRWLAATPPNLEETAAAIDRILRDGRAADETMQHIRTLFRRESFDKKEASVPEMISEAIRLIEQDPNKRKLPLKCTFEKDLPKIAVDPIQIQEVFVNLISNAIEAMENNVREPELAVLASIVDSDQMSIQVIDNGPGVDDPDKIFDAFVTTKAKGMGIGLAVSRSIVEAHDGQLWAENNPDYGARFTLTLPLRKSTRSSPAPATCSAHNLNRAPQGIDPRNSWNSSMTDWCSS
jgi:PAS domain S-box-containing protein